MTEAQNKNRIALRLSANLSKKSADALAKTSESTGLSKTEIINKAVQMYAMVTELQDNGDAVYIREEGGELTRVRFY